MRLMAVLAHPDDESLGMGGTLAKYSAEGVETYLVTATRGERGRYGELDYKPSLAEVGKLRERELRNAARTLGIKKVDFLDYIDGDLDRADPLEAIARIAKYIREYRPQIVITFGPEGGYGHPDHIAISQFAGAAIVQAGNPNYHGYGDIEMPNESHSVSKLYYMSWGREKWEAYQAAFKKLVVKVDGIERSSSPYPDWQITTRVDTAEQWQRVWKAVLCHQTQLAIYGKLKDLPEEQHRAIWGTQEFYRAFSSVNGGRTTETDLFEGLR